MVRRKAVFVSFLSLFFGFLFHVPGTTPNFAPVLKLAAEVAIFHQSNENQLKALAEKALQIQKKLAVLPPEYVQSFVTDLTRTATAFPKALSILNEQMGELRYRMVERELHVFDVKFTQWATQFDAARREARRLSNLVAEFNGIQGKALASSLQEAASSLVDLYQDLRELHVRFQVIANLLEMFRQSGFKMVPPDTRVLGEDFERHVSRTGHSGVADPKQPGKIFASHSRYAIEDKEPKHDIWACEATIVDFVAGRVKGTDHAYNNSAKVPFCLRCHEQRSGKHNMRWCTSESRSELVRACNILTKTSR